MVRDIEAFRKTANKFGLTSMEQNEVLKLMLALAGTLPASQARIDAEAYVLHTTESKPRIRAALTDLLQRIVDMATL